MPLARPPQPPRGLTNISNVSKCRETLSPLAGLEILVFRTHFLSHSSGVFPTWLLESTASCLVGIGAGVSGSLSGRVVEGRCSPASCLPLGWWETWACPLFPANGVILCSGQQLRARDQRLRPVANLACHGEGRGAQFSPHPTAAVVSLVVLWSTGHKSLESPPCTSGPHPYLSIPWVGSTS